MPSRNTCPRERQEKALDGPNQPHSHQVIMIPPVPATELAPGPNWPSKVPKTAAFLVTFSFAPTLVTRASRGGWAPWITKSNPGAAMNAVSVERVVSNSCFQAARAQRSIPIALGRSPFPSSCRPKNLGSDVVVRAA